MSRWHEKYGNEHCEQCQTLEYSVQQLEQELSKKEQEIQRLESENERLERDIRHLESIQNERRSYY